MPIRIIQMSRKNIITRSGSDRKSSKARHKAAPAEEKPAPKAPLESTVSSKTGSPFLTQPFPTTENQTKNVELYVKADCSQCFLLESVLRQRKIIYAEI